MDIIVELVRSMANGILTILQIAMLIRAVMSWFPLGENTISNIVFAITEPVIIPVRSLLERFETVRNFPIDLSFFVTFIIISILSSVLFP